MNNKNTRSRRSGGLYFLLALILVLASLIAPAHPMTGTVHAAAAITVTTTADVIGADGLCSLREAVIAANQDRASGGGVAGECAAGSGADTILIPAGEYVLTRTDSGKEDAAQTGDLDLTQSASLVGGGRVVIAGAANFTDRILHILGGDVLVAGVTLQGGRPITDGGAILNRGTLTLTDSTLRDNQTPARGGGLYNAGTARLTNVTVSGNRARSSGGGLFNVAGLTELNGVTVAFNVADDDRNGAGDGGGLARSAGTLALRNSILARNEDASPGTRRPDCTGVMDSQGYILVGDPAGCTLAGVTDGNLAGVDPTLGPLQDNGGYTPTHALLYGSLAINAANPAAPGSGGYACPAGDQRGAPRPAGPRCDMGAFEWHDQEQTGPDYQVVATVGVDDDRDDGVCSYVHCSLREAIVAANASPNGAAPDQIIFNLVNPPGGQATIYPGLPLPAITDPVVLDGSTQPGGALALDGTNAGAGAAGLTVLGGGSTIRGLVITAFGGHGLLLAGQGSNLVAGNAIHGNGGDGVRVESGSDNRITANSIDDNGGLGIDLEGDGPTPNDAGDLDDGANGRVNAPVLLSAVPAAGALDLVGRHHGASDSAFDLEFFAVAACDASGFGEGKTSIGGVAITTDATGDAYFTPSLVGAPAEGFVTVTATDPKGNTSEFSACLRIGPDNDAWPQALDLGLAGDPLAAGYEQFLDRPGQSRWYRFQVQPESKLTVTLTDLPANYDLTVYRDIAAAFSDAGSTDDLERLGAEFAPDAFSPDAYSPDAFSPDAFSPDAYSPDAFSPDAFSPDAYSPDAYSPDAFSPDAYSPDAYSPDAYSPDAYSPDAYSPDAYSPDAYSPDAFSPDAYSSAQSRSLIAVSAFEGAAGEGVQLNTHLNTGNYYVRVRGRSGVFDPGNPFRLGVQLLTGVCREVAPISTPSTTAAVAGGYRTIVLADTARMAGSPEEMDALQVQIAALIARPEVQGILVDVGADARVAAANAQADLHPACPYAKNLVAEAIREIVLAYRTANPLEYVVIVGNDDVIPFFRHPDQALLASEKNYVPPVRDNTASQASLRQGYVLSQDDYGAMQAISVKDDSYPLPDLAVGRLVETAADAAGMIEAYLTTAGGVVPAPQSLLVTGYDFLEDSALAVRGELEAGAGVAAQSLIAPRALSPQDPASWTAAELRAQLLDRRNDLVFLAGHFSASSALAADYTTRLRTTELTASPVDMTNAIIFSAGCHSGYNIVNAHGIPSVTQEPDWAQAFALKRATLIAGAGYQYGDTDFIEYSERLYLEFSRQLRAGSGPVSLGKALVQAKQAYLAQVPQLRGIHEKVLLQATLFGLPMLSVDMPGARLNPASDPSIVGGLNGYAANPGATLGLQYADVRLAPSLTLKTVQLKDVQTGLPVTATYFTGADGVASGPAEPVLPLEAYNVTAPGQVLRGVGFRGGAYTDLSDVLPLINAATTEIRGVHSPFPADVFYPVRLWNANYFDALFAQAGAGQTTLMVTPAQFIASGSGAETGTLRRFDALDFRLFYSNNTGVYGGGSTPARSNAPAITAVASTINGDSVEIRAHVLGDPAAGVQEVWAIYTSVTGSFTGSWRPLDLAQDSADSSLWRGVLDLQGTPPADVRFIIQAVNGVGLAAFDANLGAYYVPGAQALPTDPTRLVLDAPAGSGPYGSQATFSAVLTSSGAPLAGMPVAFRLGPQSRLAFTDSGGRATATLSLLGLPGPNEVRASFAGSSRYVASSAAAPFIVVRQSTVLTLDPNPAVVAPGAETQVTATLMDATGRRLGERTVFFVVSGNGESHAAAEITDYAGRASLRGLFLPVGDYTLTGYFSGSVPLPDGALVLYDERYEPSTVTGSLTVEVNNPPDCTAARPSVVTIWPPDKKPYPVSVIGITEPDGDPVTITFTGIYQDEPVGSNDASPDGWGVGTSTAEIRAERAGNSDGRVYHLFFTAADGQGGSCQGVVRVGITHDQGGNLDPIDGGPLHDSTRPG
jgi:CSLREA domain-containing protein